MITATKLSLYRNLAEITGTQAQSDREKKMPSLPMQDDGDFVSVSWTKPAATEAIQKPQPAPEKSEPANVAAQLPVVSPEQPELKLEAPTASAVPPLLSGPYARSTLRAASAQLGGNISVRV